jgi:hypothetical protein
MLLTVLATIPFLAALGIAMLVLQATIGGSRDKILAALRCESPLTVAVSRPVNVRFSPRSARAQPMRAAPRLRVAA